MQMTMKFYIKFNHAELSSKIAEDSARGGGEMLNGVPKRDVRNRGGESSFCFSRFAVRAAVLLLLLQTLIFMSSCGDSEAERASTNEPTTERTTRNKHSWKSEELEPEQSGIEEDSEPLASTVYVKSELSVGSSPVVDAGDSLGNDGFPVYGFLTGEENPAFRGLFRGTILDGKIGKRPESGIVRDLQYDPRDFVGENESKGYEEYHILEVHFGIRNPFRFPQIASKSRGAREFNEIIAKRAKAEYMSDIRQILGSYKYSTDQANMNSISGVGKEVSLSDILKIGFEGWTYIDYAVLESKRYVSIVIVKLRSMNTSELYFETYVYDKNDDMLLTPKDIAGDFALDVAGYVNRIENRIFRNHADLYESQPLRYMEVTRRLLTYLWNVFYNWENISMERGQFEVFYNKGAFDRRPMFGLIVGPQGELLTMLGIVRRLGVSDFAENYLRAVDAEQASEGAAGDLFGLSDRVDEGRFLTAASFEILTLKQLFGDPSLGERERLPMYDKYIAELEAQRNPLFDGRVSDRFDVLLVYLGNAADDATASRVWKMMEDNPSLSLGQVGTIQELTSYPRQMYLVIPKYAATYVKANVGEREVYGDAVGPTVVFASVAHDKPVQLRMRSRSDWAYWELPLAYSYPLESDRVLDITPIVFGSVSAGGTGAAGVEGSDISGGAGAGGGYPPKLMDYLRFYLEE